MVERSVIVTTKQVYQEKIEAQLKEWQVGLDKLKVKTHKAKAEAKLEYQRQLEDLSAKQQVARQKFEALKQAGSEKWVDLKANLDYTMTELQQGFERFKTTGQQYGDDVLSWAKGIAKEHNLHSIGWAEGIATEKEIESIGWAEGVAEENKIESQGWVEGYGKR